VLSGCVLIVSYDIHNEHASSPNPALALYAPPAGLRPVAAPGPQTMPAALPSVVTPPSAPGARMPDAPEAPVASFIMPMQSPGLQMPAAPESPVFMVPAPVDSTGTRTGPQMLGAGFFAGLASSFAVGFAMTAKRMYDGMKSSGDFAEDLELGTFPGRAGVPMMKMKLRTGDKVELLCGDNKGEAGKVLMIDKKKNMVLVEGINQKTKHMKPMKEGESGSILKKEFPVHISNVKVIDDDSAAPAAAEA